MAGDQRCDQRQQGVEVGGEIHVHVGEDGGVGTGPHLAQGPAPALFLQAGAAYAVQRGGEPTRDLRGAVGARVVGDRDPEGIGEGPAEVLVQSAHARAEVLLLVEDRDHHVEDGLAGHGREGRPCRKGPGRGVGSHVPTLAGRPVTVVC